VDVIKQYFGNLLMRESDNVSSTSNKSCEHAVSGKIRNTFAKLLFAL